ncbi:MAG: lipocalin-like domain-containing protein [Acidobacteria bacterium]|nr:lipocalin-like domain-containing protein [Acidobacteriota bacterium]
MRTTRFALLATVAVILGVSFACGGSEPAEPAAAMEAANPNDRFAGAWSLVRSERRDADGELIGEPLENREGYIMYDPAGYMGVALMQADREPYSEDGPTADEALAQMGSYASYFGRFTVNEAEGYVTHHLEGSLNPDGAGSDYQRFFTFEGDNLILQPPASEDGARSFITWERLPALPESELTDTHRRLFGAYRVESISRETTDGEPIEVDQYETAYIMYAPSGHMSVHLMRPGRMPYAGDEPTAEEALATVLSYGSYFGPFSVNEEESYLVHHRIGNEDPGQSGTDAQRFYELTDTHLALRPPVGVDDEGREGQSTILWARLD